MYGIYETTRYSKSSYLFIGLDKANLKNIFVSPYPTLFYRYGSVSRKIIILTSQIGYPLNLIVYVNLS